MKAESFRDLSRDELETRVQQFREQLLKLRFQQSTGQIESPQMLRGMRRDIARALTILRERDIEETAGRGAATGAAQAAASGSTGEEA